MQSCAVPLKRPEFSLTVRAFISAVIHKDQILVAGTRIIVRVIIAVKLAPIRLVLCNFFRCAVLISPHTSDVQGDASKRKRDRGKELHALYSTPALALSNTQESEIPITTSNKF